eukprot:gb/GEZN01027813.1/.p1 GENE.gb/GEZN01027813.1/~~gb/GEZN01027813.1/.p1  ORF type:complete len:107 (-),score=0.60 gb/GEZN01027813.1/:39-359(-)
MLSILLSFVPLSAQNLRCAFEASCAFHCHSSRFSEVLLKVSAITVDLEIFPSAFIAFIIIFSEDLLICYRCRLANHTLQSSPAHGIIMLGFIGNAILFWIVFSASS